MSEEEPYLYKTETVTHRSYNPDYGDDRNCKCGHPYYRHFDTYEDMDPVGCKYCGCYDFERPTKKAKKRGEKCYTFVYVAETDGEVLLNTVSEEGVEAFEAQLKRQGITHHDYAIIEGSVLKSFNSAGGYDDKTDV